MPTISVHEGASEKAIFTPVYDQRWPDPTKAGTPVLQGDVSKTFFWVKALDTDTDGWLKLDSSDSTQIAWVSGNIEVYFNGNTVGHSGDGQVYELRLKMIDGSYQTLESGIFNVKQSVTGNPS